MSRAHRAHPTLAGGARTALLLAMVWIIWVYTTWVTNWLDPDRLPVRLMLLALMLASLVLSAALPEAFGSGGLWVGIAYAVMQVGRSAFAAAAALPGAPSLQRNFTRIGAGHRRCGDGPAGGSPRIASLPRGRKEHSPQ